MLFRSDLLELAQVGLYRAVVGKGMYATGDWAVYIPEGSVLSADLIEELGLTGKLAGSNANRVKAVRLRGELSQGIVCRPRALSMVDLEAAAGRQEDFAEQLGITKWVPPVPIHMQGAVEPAPDLLPWLEIENIRRYPNLFDEGELVVATEKVHGTCCMLTYSADTEQTLVSSKGFGSKHLALVHDDKNLYWRVMESYGVPRIAAEICDQFGVRRVGIFGEIYGTGIQDLHYGAKDPSFVVFDVAIEQKNGHARWLNQHELDMVMRLRLPVAEVIYQGPYIQDLMLSLAEGPEMTSGTSAHLREGIVIRPTVERYSPITGGRTIGKLISPTYLGRSDRTEYE